MKAILISINPKWVKEILNGNKTIEIRKRFPKDYVGWVYIYCTKDKKYANLINRGGFLTGMVVARFWCDKVENIRSYLEPEQWYMTSDLGGSGLLRKSCLDFHELDDYLLSGNGYAIHITKLEIFDKPKEINELKRVPYEKCGQYDSKGLVWCGRCPYGIEEGYGCDCKYNEPLKAPQSWCYVEI